MLYLVRHAEAVREIEDARQPLSERGRQEMERVAGFLATCGIAVDRILHSGKLRAKQTAEILAAALHPALGAAEAEGLAPLDDPVHWFEKIDETAESLMLVSHLPCLPKLCSLLLYGEQDSNVVTFNPGSVLCLRGEAKGLWFIQWMVTPSILCR